MDCQFVFLDLSGDGGDAANSTLYAQELDLRYRVMRKPLGMGVDTVKFPFDLEALHLVAVDTAATIPVVVGCVMLMPVNATTCRLFQMAVDTSVQKRGIGRALVDRILDRAARDGFRECTLHARHNAVDFYRRLGFAVFGDEFSEVGIPHRHMRIDIPLNPAARK
ncbi:hypothetical protein HDU82_000394 [Entophlyctis luteolus]|nr:hypothetical protein HDU82_000394 [Entophlyctis luteolus]